MFFAETLVETKFYSIFATAIKQRFGSSVGQNTCLSRMGSRVRVPSRPLNWEKRFRDESLFCPKKASKIVVLFSLRLCNSQHGLVVRPMKSFPLLWIAFLILVLFLLFKTTRIYYSKQSKQTIPKTSCKPQTS